MIMTLLKEQNTVPDASYNATMILINSLMKQLIIT
jgi:hypothetical protein